LRCKDCGNFTAFAPKSAKKYPWKILKKDITYLFHVIEKIEVLQIQGGEAFLYNELSELIYLLKESEKVCTIQIATNGSLCPTPGQIECFKKCNVFVRISDYSIIPKEKINKSINLYIENDIKYGIYHFYESNSTWADLGTGINPDENEQFTQEKFIQCAFSQCLTLENGRLGHCSRSIMAQGVQGIKLNKDDYVFVRKNKHLKYDLVKYIEERKYMECCKYCNGTKNTKQIKPAIQAPADMKTFKDLVTGKQYTFKGVNTMKKLIKKIILKYFYQYFKRGVLKVLKSDEARDILTFSKYQAIETNNNNIANSTEIQNESIANHNQEIEMIKMAERENLLNSLDLSMYKLQSLVILKNIQKEKIFQNSNHEDSI
jgi:hypothetical protein